MLIVNQNKDLVVNVNKVEMIGINPDCKEQIACTFETGAQDIGIYENEARAKEVFLEIINRYKNWENLKAGQAAGVCLPVYEMPKE